MQMFKGTYDMYRVEIIERQSSADVRDVIRCITNKELAEAFGSKRYSQDLVNYYPLAGEESMEIAHRYENFLETIDEELKRDMVLILAKNMVNQWNKSLINGYGWHYELKTIRKCGTLEGRLTLYDTLIVVGNKGFEIKDKFAVNYFELKGQIHRFKRPKEILISSTNGYFKDHFLGVKVKKNSRENPLFMYFVSKEVYASEILKALNGESGELSYFSFVLPLMEEPKDNIIRYDCIHFFALDKYSKVFVISCRMKHLFCGYDAWHIEANPVANFKMKTYEHIVSSCGLK